MSKYIIDIPKTVGMGKVGSVHYTYFDGIQCQTIVLKSDEIEELNSDYIKEHYGDLQDEAYHRGLEEGKKAFDLLDAERDAEYQRGLNDAWEAAKKLSYVEKYGGYGDRLDKVFDRTDIFDFLDYSPNEAIDKLKAYEEKQKAEDEIKVGDEVETKDGKRFVVTTFGSGFDGDIAVGVCADGLGLGVDLKELCKTGRHFDIASILKEMQS